MIIEQQNNEILSSLRIILISLLLVYKVVNSEGWNKE